MKKLLLKKKKYDKKTYYITDNYLMTPTIQIKNKYNTFD